MTNMTLPKNLRLAASTSTICSWGTDPLLLSTTTTTTTTTTIL